MNFTEEHIDILIARKLSGEITPAEATGLEQWIQSDTLNKNYFENQVQVWNKTMSVAELGLIDVDAEWAKLSGKIDGEGKQIRIGRKTGLLAFRNIAAAVIIIALISFCLVYFLGGNNEKIMIAQNEPVNFSLPDGSQISMNRNTEIMYPEMFTKDERKIRMEKGDAFFEIAADKEKPFRINVDNEMVVEVVGTSFYINTGGETEDITIIVETGQVAVYKKNKPETKIFLTPGEKGVYDRSAEAFESVKNDDQNYLSWKTKKLVFENSPLPYIISVINNVYGSKISLGDSELAGCMLTGTFENYDLEAILNLIESSLDVSIKREDNVIEIYGKGC
ncbi:MAG: FecR domain-containing protein [Bacteroidota bacterium]